MRYPVMTEKHVADRWQVSLKTLRRWRLDGQGPIWHKLFRHVRYHEVDILEFERRSAQFLMTLLGIDREFKPADEDVGAAFDAQGSRYLTAKDIAEAASLPLHIFQDRAERERKQIPHLMLGGNLRFSLQAILEPVPVVRHQPGRQRRQQRLAIPLQPSSAQRWRLRPTCWACNTTASTSTLAFGSGLGMCRTSTPTSAACAAGCGASRAWPPSTWRLTWAGFACWIARPDLPRSPRQCWFWLSGLELIRTFREKSLTFLLLLSKR
ncbi:hypothetical protein Alide_1884 [Alicycliphilus denitrificans BC]|nr:hypothetical protein Alide_1884 [Alicycliphilus denitrificans BC]